MEVYIELAIIDNLLINGMILFLTSFSLRHKIRFWRLFLSAFLGMLLAVLLPLLTLNTVSLFIIKLCLGNIMCLVMNKKLTIREYFLYYLMFLTFTFVLGGFCFFINFLVGGTMEHFPIPTSIIVLFMFLYIFFLIKAIIAFYSKKKMQGFIYNVKIIEGDKKLTLKAYLDSGNTLVDEQKPVIIINPRVFDKLYKTKFHEVLFFKKFEGLKNPHFMEYNTISGKGKILVFDVDNFEIPDKHFSTKDISLGVSLRPFSKDFDAIMGVLE